MFGTRRTADDPSVATKERFATLIGERTTIKGDLSLAEGVRIDGRLEGNTGREGDAPVTVVIGQNGSVTGNIVATRVVVAGQVLGTIQADEEVELHATAVIQGDVHCKSLRIAHGARVMGRIATADHPAVSRPTLVVDQRDVPKVANGSA
ncbi:MAG: hypothetical protein RLY78_4314 [Pseudomonadota bacterium]|jgi:cytoskeletal protein CcmA (bactofilin family)|uniref:Polymer-forming cytoskeletal protein n=1 Tax=Pseudaquabacterium rugosum TaxID=2984194 RepID=A0ABU9BGA9_9BURK